MKRRELLLAALATAAATGGTACSQAAQGGVKRIAFMISGHASVIDLAGAWEVFQDTGGFELYTVGPSRRPLAIGGGLLVQPTYAFDEAPQPDMISVGAQRGGPDATAWLRRASEKAQVVMSVCTGAFQLGRAGLLDGLQATTHHEYYDAFEKEFPKVRLVRGHRFTDNGKIVTAGGLTSGVDGALHVVARLRGDEAAQQTAAYMEHDGAGWRTGLRG